MKKKWISVILTLALTIGTCSVAAAAERGSATKNELKSYGTIEYQKDGDRVSFHANDLYELADRIDQLKLDTVDQLEEMCTFFTAGDGISLRTDRYVSVAHTRPTRENFVDPLDISFATLLEGVGASQSITSDVEAYGYSSGTTLYIDAEGRLTTDSAAEGAKKINISPATADNLSAGMAAWVNGELILGTGRDNQTHFEEGYAKGGGEADDPEDPDPGFNDDYDTALSRTDCIKMSGSDGKATSYTVQEDMTSVILVLNKKSADATKTEFNNPGFDTTFKEIYTKTYKGPNYTRPCTVWFVPTLKKGTVISNIKGSNYLIRFKDENRSNLGYEFVKGSSKSQTDYFISKDMKNVLLIQQSGSTGSQGPGEPKFQEAAGEPIILYKKLFRLGGKLQYGSSSQYAYFNVYFIPDLKEGSVVKIGKNADGILLY